MFPKPDASPAVFAGDFASQYLREDLEGANVRHPGKAAIHCSRRRFRSRRRDLGCPRNHRICRRSPRQCYFPWLISFFRSGARKCAVSCGRAEGTCRVRHLCTRLSVLGILKILEFPRLTPRLCGGPELIPRAERAPKVCPILHQFGAGGGAHCVPTVVCAQRAENHSTWIVVFRELFKLLRPGRCGGRRV